MQNKNHFYDSICAQQFGWREQRVIFNTEQPNTSKDFVARFKEANENRSDNTADLFALKGIANDLKKEKGDKFRQAMEGFDSSVGKERNIILGDSKFEGDWKDAEIEAYRTKLGEVLEKVKAEARMGIIVRETKTREKLMAEMGIDVEVKQKQEARDRLTFAQDELAALTNGLTKEKGELDGISDDLAQGGDLDFVQINKRIDTAKAKIVAAKTAADEAKRTAARALEGIDPDVSETAEDTTGMLEVARKFLKVLFGSGSTELSGLNLSYSGLETALTDLDGSISDVERSAEQMTAAAELAKKEKEAKAPAAQPGVVLSMNLAQESAEQEEPERAETKMEAERHIVAKGDNGLGKILQELAKEKDGVSFSWNFPVEYRYPDGGEQAKPKTKNLIKAGNLYLGNEVYLDSTGGGTKMVVELQKKAQWEAVNNDESSEKPEKKGEVEDEEIIISQGVET